MGFKEEIKVKKDYFTKSYTKNEILKVFNFMIKRAGMAGEVLGEIQDIKITEIDGEVITVEAKMKDSDNTKLYRFSLEFNKMENEEYTREAKIASPERFGKAIELKETSTNKEKEEYYQGVVDYWDDKEEREKRILREVEISSFLEKYKKEDILKTVDTMIENSVNSGDILGEVVDRKIAKIEGNMVTVAIQTKDGEEHIRIYRMNLHFDKMNSILYSDKAKVSSLTRTGSTIELQSDMNNEQKQKIYNKLPDLLTTTEMEIEEK